MASAIHTIGQYTYRRTVKQGAPQKADELKRVYPVTIRLTRREYIRWMKAKQSCFLRSSEFGALVIDNGLRELFESNNSSKQ